MPEVALAETPRLGSRCSPCARQSVAVGFAVVVAATGLWIAAARLTPLGVSCLVAWAAGLMVAFCLALDAVDPDRRRTARQKAEQAAASRGLPDTPGWGRVLYLSLAAFTVVTALAPLVVEQAHGARLKSPTGPTISRPATA